MPRSPLRPLPLAVVGRPILPSRSGALFRRLCRDSGIEGTYTRLAVDEVGQAVALAGDLGLHGLNVTAPLKERAAACAARLFPEARATGAVNTLLPDGAGWRGANTDPAGVDAALAGVVVRGRPVLVLGAGGAARAAAFAALRAGAASVVVVNRTEARARALARDLPVHPAPLASLRAEVGRCRVLLSCVSGDPDLVAPAWLSPDHAVLDADYRAQGLRVAVLAAGARFIPGTRWLAGQALAAFALFSGPAESTQADLEGLASVEPPPPVRVLLAGFMGAGKTSVGRALAARLGWEHVDCDALVEAEAGCTVAEVFRREGEPGFRERERRAVAHAVGAARSVLSLGGGALHDPATRALLTGVGLLVLLWAPLPVLLARSAGGERPLIGQGDPAALLARRRDGYLAAADLVVAAHPASAEDVAARIRSELRAVGAAP